MKTVKLPAQGTVFDYYLEPQSRKFLPWSDLVPPFEMEPQTPLQVRTREAPRLTGGKLLSNFSKAVWLIITHSGAKVAIFRTNNQQ